MRLANPWKGLRDAIGGERVAPSTDRDVSNSSPSTTKTVEVKAKDVHVRDLYEGYQVVHKETLGPRAIVLLTLGGAGSEGRRLWLWSDEMVLVHRADMGSPSSDRY